MLNKLIDELKEKMVIFVTIKVHAGARESKITGIMADGKIKVDIKEAREKGKANEAVKKLLAKAFAVDSSNVIIKSGASSNLKLIKIFK